MLIPQHGAKSSTSHSTAAQVGQVKDQNVEDMLQGMPAAHGSSSTKPRSADD